MIQGQVVITGGQFTQHVSQDTGRLDRAIKILYQKTYPGAFYNTVDPLQTSSLLLPAHSPSIEAIMDWLSNSDPQNIVMWLDGRAKSGKSAICYAVAQICMGRHILSGSFSFPPDGNHVVARLIATLIYQLLLNIPETRNIIAEKIALDISILDRSWETQLDRLLIQPLVAVTQSGVLQDDQRGPRLFIIDGLDKCDEKTRCFVIETLTAALEKIPKSIPHKLLFASRSESRLVSTCRKPPIATRMLRLHLDDSLDPSNGSTRLPELSPVKSFMDLWGNLSVLQLELNERRVEADKLEMRRLQLDEREEEIRKKEEEWKKKEEEWRRKEEEWKKKEREMQEEELKIQIIKDLQRELPHPRTRKRELPIPVPLSVARAKSMWWSNESSASDATSPIGNFSEQRGDVVNRQPNDIDSSVPLSGDLITKGGQDTSCGIFSSKYSS